MVLSRRAFRLLLALCIGSACAPSVATDLGLSVETGDISAADFGCPYGACHRVSESETGEPESDSAAVVEEAVSQNQPNGEYAPTSDSSSLPAASAQPGQHPFGPTAGPGYGFDHPHPAYGHPYYRYSYYRHLQNGSVPPAEGLAEPMPSQPASQFEPAALAEESIAAPAGETSNATAIEPASEAPVESTAAPADSADAADNAQTQADRAECDPAPLHDELQYDWQIVPNQNCDLDETLSARTADGYHAPEDDLPNYDFPAEPQPPSLSPDNLHTGSLNLDEVEQNAQWPGEPQASGEPRGRSAMVAAARAWLTRTSQAIRSGMGAIQTPDWLLRGWEAASARAAQLETAAIEAAMRAPEPSDEQTSVGGRREAVLALAQSIDQLGAALQQFSRHLERVADDDVIGRSQQGAECVER